MVEEAGLTGLSDAVEQRYAESPSKLFMTLEDAISLSVALGLRIRGLTPSADLIVGLANGGTLPAIVAAETAGLECRIVRVRHKSSALKQKLSPLRKLAWKIPAIAIRGRQLVERVDQLSANPYEFDAGEEIGEVAVAGRHIVIVDDAVATGRSVALVRNALLSRGAASIRIAVNCWAANYDSNATHNIAPDIYQHRVIHFYPWSHNSAEYDHWIAWLAKRGLMVWD
jgi:hypoxanthine phosphoribosyltransferase